MNSLHHKLYEKYNQFKTSKFTELEELNRNQEEKFLAFTHAADELLQQYRLENERLVSENDDLRSELASARSSMDGKIAEHQKLVMEENKKPIEIIDDTQGRGEQVAKRMLKKLHQSANPPKPTSHAFCQKVGKRFRDVDGHMQTAFMPAWDIYDQHSVSGSSLLAKDWSRECITPADRISIVERTGLEEAEELGASAAYKLNSYFQAAIYQANAFKESEISLLKEKSCLTRAMKDWKSRANSAEDMVASLLNKVKTLENGLGKKEEQIIDEYMDSDPFPNSWMIMMTGYAPWFSPLVGTKPLRRWLLSTRVCSTLLSSLVLTSQLSPWLPLLLLMILPLLRLRRRKTRKSQLEIKRPRWE
ncbi:uncharacterized protein LOC108215365 isoform X2 [Daucus carota subsp. sativus]|uniref:uncharacterized protein LOC108215365 isoform X2 n=1 Tax=Daucus carota subsp. sativus TaxID=79200 RepID=UPI0007EF4C86|nr:PREDICTED: uncharacterized protein LOC108215365 isoform X2 [Daucus carota subsp. sativus]